MGHTKNKNMEGGRWNFPFRPLMILYRIALCTGVLKCIPWSLYGHWQSAKVRGTPNKTCFNQEQHYWMKGNESTQTEVECTCSAMQCTLHCSYTADTLQTAVSTVPTLHIHCSYLVFRDCRCTASTLQVHCHYTVNTRRVHCNWQCTLQNGLLWQHFVHCTYTASTWQCPCSVRAA